MERWESLEDVLVSREGEERSKEFLEHTAIVGDPTSQCGTA